MEIINFYGLKEISRLLAGCEYSQRMLGAELFVSLGNEQGLNLSPIPIPGAVDEYLEDKIHPGVVVSFGGFIVGGTVDHKGEAIRSHIALGCQRVVVGYSYEINIEFDRLFVDAEIADEKNIIQKYIPDITSCIMQNPYVTFLQNFPNYQYNEFVCRQSNYDFVENTASARLSR